MVRSSRSTSAPNLHFSTSVPSALPASAAQWSAAASSEQVPSRASLSKQEQVQGFPSATTWQLSRYTVMPHVISREQRAVGSPFFTPSPHRHEASIGPPFSHVSNA